MQIGEVLADGMTTHTPWFDRAADNAVFSFEKIAGAGTFTVTVYTKNFEETGNGALISGISFTEITASTGFYSAEVSQGASDATKMKEQVRFKLVMSGSGDVLYRFFPPTWFDTAEVYTP